MGDAIYPFSALVGQGAMKRALVLAAIHPGLGGVLIRGSKGAAKSTAVRALAALLPAIDVFEADPMNRDPGEDVAAWPLPEGARIIRRPVALVNLPVGATDDRVVGSLDLERALATGARRFEPGLLAAAHRGILYIDEVNLLGDHLVDLLLDAAAMGTNHVEREGVAVRHPARFVLVGTMNPEEGDLRPQLLDRFGLAVDVEAMTDPTARAEVVRRRLAFEADPVAFGKTWAEADRIEGEKIVRAQQLLPRVHVPDAVLGSICIRCAREGADGLRADLTIYKAASALAAYEGRSEVTLADVDAVAELALAHRRTRPPEGPTPPPTDGDRPESDRSSTRSDRPEKSGETANLGADRGPVADGGDSQILPADEPVIVAAWRPRTSLPRRADATGRKGRPGPADRLGPCIGARRPIGPATDPALIATLRAAAPHQHNRGRLPEARPILRAHDIRSKVRARPIRHLILFVVDASRSMGARERMRQTKSAVLALLVDAYQRRDRVGLIAFGRAGARLALPPTRSVGVAARALAGLPIGGATPLASALELAGRVVDAERRRAPGVAPLVVLLTDGRGNLPINPDADPIDEAIDRARRLAEDGIAGMVIDTENGPVRLGLAQSLAGAWGAEFRELDRLEGPRLPEAVRQALFARGA